MSNMYNLFKENRFVMYGQSPTPAPDPAPQDITVTGVYNDFRKALLWIGDGIKDAYKDGKDIYFDWFVDKPELIMEIFDDPIFIDPATKAPKIYDFGPGGDVQRFKDISTACNKALNKIGKDLPSLTAEVEKIKKLDADYNGGLFVGGKAYQEGGIAKNTRSMDAQRKSTDMATSQNSRHSSPSVRSVTHGGEFDGRVNVPGFNPNKVQTLTMVNPSLGKGLTDVDDSSQRDYATGKTTTELAAGIKTDSEGIDKMRQALSNFTIDPKVATILKERNPDELKDVDLSIPMDFEKALNYVETVFDKVTAQKVLLDKQVKNAEKWVLNICKKYPNEKACGGIVPKTTPVTPAGGGAGAANNIGPV